MVLFESVKVIESHWRKIDAKELVEKEMSGFRDIADVGSAPCCCVP